MTFSYTPSTTPDDVTRVRWHVEDTKAPGLLSDEEINMAIAENDNDWKQAAIRCIDAIMSKLAKESGVQMDWLRVDRSKALKHYRQLKLDKQRELGVSSQSRIRGQVVHISRNDSPPEELW